MQRILSIIKKSGLMAQQVQGLFPGPGDQSHNEENLLSKYVQAKPSTSDAVGNDHLFYSNIMAGEHRLHNGDTLITEADTGRICEVTMEGDVINGFAFLLVI
jgi:hypothetical protein